VRLTLDDEATLCSVGILAEAVRLAYSAFSRVDRDFRDQIAHHALQLAALRRQSAGPMRIGGGTPPRRAGRGVDEPRRA
jgi:hypothetical protein